MSHDPPKPESLWIARMRTKISEVLGNNSPIDEFVHVQFKAHTRVLLKNINEVVHDFEPRPIQFLLRDGRRWC